MSSTEDNNISSMDSKMISEPPLSLLFNPSLLTTKKDVWDIDVTMLLDMLLKLIGKTLEYVVLQLYHHPLYTD
jgi:hypothetical protein